MSNSYEQTDIYKSGANAAGGILSIVPGYRIEVDSTDPQNPIVSVKVGEAGFSTETFPIASTRNATGIPNINNGGGALLGTLYYSPINWELKKLNCFVKQIGGGAIRLAVYSVAGALMGVTAPFIPAAIGFKSMPIIAGPGGIAIDKVEQIAETAYYLVIHGTSAANGAQFYGSDVGTTFGPTPWVGWTVDNITITPDTIAGGSESSQRFYIGATGVL